MSKNTTKMENRKQKNQAKTKAIKWVENLRS